MEPVYLEEYRKKNASYTLIESGAKSAVSVGISQQFLQALVQNVPLNESMERLCAGLLELIEADSVFWMGSDDTCISTEKNRIALSPLLKKELLSRIKHLDGSFFTLESLVHLGVLPGRILQELKKTGVASFFVAPVVSEFEFQGLLLVIQSKKQDWTPQEVAWMESITLNVSASLRFQKEREEMQKALEREQVISRIITHMSQTFDEKRILKAAAKEVGQYLGADRCLMVQFDSHDDQLSVQSMEQFCQEAIPPVRLADLPRSMLYKNIHPTKEGEPDKSKAQQTPSTSDYSVNIIYRGIPLGAMVLHRCGEAPQWSIHEVDFLHTVATHLGAALFQSSLYYQEQKAKEDARNTLLRKNQYLASMTHELRTPLHSIITCSNMGIENMLGTLTEKQMEYMQLINQSGEHLLNMIDDLLDLAKIESGKLILTPRRINILHVIQETCAMMLPQFKKKQQHFYLCVDDKFPATIQADATRLKQVFLNLLSNAHKFTPEQACIEVSCGFNAEEMVVQVKDTGMGIPAEELEKIFEPFEQASNKTEFAQKKGTGLGLSIAKSITEMHGGRLDVQSALGKGSVFSVVLPYLEKDMF